MIVLVMTLSYLIKLLVEFSSTVMKTIMIMITSLAWAMAHHVSVYAHVGDLVIKIGFIHVHGRDAVAENPLYKGHGHAHRSPCGRMVFLGFFMLVNENLIIPSGTSG